MPNTTHREILEAVETFRAETGKAHDNIHKRINALGQETTKAIHAVDTKVAMIDVQTRQNSEQAKEAIDEMHRLNGRLGIVEALHTPEGVARLAERIGTLEVKDGQRNIAWKVLITVAAAIGSLFTIAASWVLNHLGAGQ